MYQHAKYTDLKNSLKNNKLKKFCINKITKTSAKPHQKKKKPQNQESISNNTLGIPNKRRKG